MATQVSERQARRVAEEARQSEWKLPSFCRELFLGALRIDLIHPQPKLDDALAKKGEAFLRKLVRFLETEVHQANHPEQGRVGLVGAPGLAAGHDRQDAGDPDEGEERAGRPELSDPAE